MSTETKGNMSADAVDPGMFADDKLDGLFSQAMQSDEKKMDLSAEESDRLTKAMKEPVRSPPPARATTRSPTCADSSWSQTRPLSRFAPLHSPCFTRSAPHSLRTSLAPHHTRSTPVSLHSSLLTLRSSLSLAPRLARSALPSPLSPPRSPPPAPRSSQEFRGLLQEYLEEISDPKNRAEYNEYITQLENDGKVPEGTQLVRPTGAFVVKLRKKVKDEKQGGDKVFLNICSSDVVEKPSGTVKEGSEGGKGKDGGMQWSLPHMLSAPHMEQDKTKSPCVVFEVCFHPETLAKAARHAAFRDMVCKTSIEVVQKSWKHYLHQECELKEGYRVLKGVVAIGGEPKVMNVQKTSLGKNGGAGDGAAAGEGTAGAAGAADGKGGAGGTVGKDGAPRSSGKSFEAAFGGALKERSSKRHTDKGSEGGATAAGDDDAAAAGGDLEPA